MEKEIKIAAPEGREIEKVELVDGVAVVTFREKERKLPKSWEEFCVMFPVKGMEYYINGTCELGVVLDCERNQDTDRDLLKDAPTAFAVLALCQLIQLRNAYNGDWVPDWTDNAQNKWFIYYERGIIRTESYTYASLSPLYFKSKELRDEFLRNFRYLIKKLKPLYGIKKGGEYGL